MFAEASDSIKAYLYDRTQSPLFGAFIASWVLWNHRLLFVLFSEMEISDKFQYIDTELYLPVTVFCFSLGGLLHPSFHIFPFLTAMIFLLIYPYPAKWIFSYWKSRQIALKYERQKLEGEELLSREDAQKLRAYMREQAAKYKAENAEKDTEIADRDKQISEQKKEISDLIANSALQSVNPPTEKELKEWIIKHNWVLVFMPKKKTPSTAQTSSSHHHPPAENTKRITFLPSGEIGDGKNNHESQWRVTEGKLEIINDKGDVFSRFYPILNDKIFVDEANADSSYGRCLVQGDFIKK